MTNKQGWTRRQFSQAVAVSAAASLLPRTGRSSASAPLSGFAFVGSAAAYANPGALHVYRVSGSDWQPLQALSTASPSHLLLHPSLPVLYALHHVAEWNHVPRGAVSAFAIDATHGQLTLKGTQPLSLAATYPRHGVVTRDGRHLFVAAEGGGMYNLLPIAKDGSLLPVAAIRKEFGLQDGARAKVASPRGVALHPDGTLLSVDPGQESLTSFQLRGSDLVLHGRTQVHAGQGAVHLALSPCGGYGYTLQAAGSAVGVHALHADGRALLLETCSGVSQASSIVVAPGGRFLLASGEDSMSILRIDPATGKLARHAQHRGMGRQMTFVADSGHLLGLDSAGVARQTRFDPFTGTVATPEVVATVANGAGLVFRSAGHLRSADRQA